MLISPADKLEEQFGSGLGEGNISQFIDDQEMGSLELFMQSLKSFFLPALHELRDQVCGCVEANVSALGTSGKPQGRDQMRLTGSRVCEHKLMSRVDYGRRRVSQPPVSRSPSPNRACAFRYALDSPETMA